MLITFLNTSSITPPLFASFSPPSLCLDFPRSDSCVCCGGFPSHCNGEVRFPQLVFCEEELAVCHLRHWRLHQLYDYHVSQRGRCPDKHQMARLHILSNKCFMKHYLEVCSRNYHIHSQKGAWVSCLSLCLMIMTHLNLFPVNANEYYHLARCMKRWPIC